VTVRYLNIEVVLGLIALAVLASIAVDIPLPPAWFIVVPLVCWSVYTLDRLFDVRDADDRGAMPTTGRHAFHDRHRTSLRIAVMCAMTIAAVTAIGWFPGTYWLAALPLGALTLLHLLLQRTRSKALAVVKDLNVAVTFALSAWAIPMVEALERGPLPAWVFAAMAASVLLVVMDVYLLSVLDADADRTAARPSIAVVVGERGRRIFTTTLRFLTASLAVFFVMDHHLPIAVILLVMTACYLVLDRIPVRNTDAARLLIDGTLLIPFALLAF
jgi:4-hydroxybenzoate polyprenyltransferase